MKGKKSIRSLAALGMAAGAVAVATPAQAGYYYDLDAYCTYAQARIWVDNGTQGRAYARHGSYGALSGWSYSFAGAFVDAGYTCSSEARVWWR